MAMQQISKAIRVAAGMRRAFVLQSAEGEEDALEVAVTPEHGGMRS